MVEVRTQVDAFADELNLVLQTALGPEVEIAVHADSNGTFRIGPGPFDPSHGGFQLIPQAEPGESWDEARKFLKVGFTLGSDQEDQHLTVLNSTFGLWLLPNVARQKKRPVFRVEYDRGATTKPAAHVHVHAESVELGWILGRYGHSLSQLQEIHFPVGGKRFRPTVEDLLLFLDREGLFRNWADDNWRDVVQRSLAEWDRRQARATARRFPEDSASQLRAMGYDVRPPEAESGQG